MIPLRCFKLGAGLAALALTLTPAAKANRPEGALPTERTGPIIRASHVALIEGGRPVCMLPLTDNPEFAPSFVELVPSGALEPEHLPRCEQRAAERLAHLAGLAQTRTRVAMLPALAVPALACVVALGAGAYFSHRTLTTGMNVGPLALANVGAGTLGGAALVSLGKVAAPAWQVSLTGFLLGGSCSLVGSLGGIAWFLHARP